MDRKLDDKERYLTPWTLEPGWQRWKRYYVFDRTDYAARVTSLTDWFALGWILEIRNPLNFRTIDECKLHIDQFLVKYGYVLLTDSQMKTMELLA